MAPHIKKLTEEKAIDLEKRRLEALAPIQQKAAEDWRELAKKAELPESRLTQLQWDAANEFLEAGKRISERRKELHSEA